MEDFYSLEWDTRFFGYKIASVMIPGLELSRLITIIGKLKENQFRLAYCFTDPRDEISNESLKKVSAMLADEKVTYSIDMNEVDIFPVSSAVIPYKTDIVSDKLVSLTLQSGQYSRFKTDPDFTNNEYARLYIEWIDKSVKRKLADEVLVYKENEEIIGFITLAVKNNIGYIGLIAVDENQRGKAIGKNLMGAALTYFKDKNVTCTEVVTQKANVIACKFYESLGFEIKDINNIYHLWIS